MKLSILERIVLQGLLPQQGDYVTYGLIKQIRTELSFTEKEIKDFKINEVINTKGESRVTWDDKTEKLKEFTFGEKVTSIIVKALEKVDKEGKIDNNNVSLYEKFMVK